jgi:hypothetical protein
VEEERVAAEAKRAAAKKAEQERVARALGGEAGVSAGFASRGSENSGQIAVWHVA